MPGSPSHRWMVILGIGSPYIAVIAGVFLLHNAWIAILAYHAILALYVYAIDRNKFLDLRKGFSWPQCFIFGFPALLCGVTIYLFWPYAKLTAIDLSTILNTYILNGISGGLFALYSIIINPILEELFWRGCFNPSLRKPALIDLAFAGYHGLALTLVLQPTYIIAAIGFLTGVSWLFRYLKHYNQGLAIPYVMHLAADISIITSIWLLSGN